MVEQLPELSDPCVDYRVRNGALVLVGEVLTSPHSGVEYFGGFRRDLNGNEILRRIEIILARLINDADVTILGGAFVRQHRINLADFERFGIPPVVNAQHV